MPRRNTVQDIRKQIVDLTEKQITALQNATYLGMTSDQQKEYDERLAQISALTQQISEPKLQQKSRSQA
jgi:hypothetical protein